MGASTVSPSILTMRQSVAGAHLRERDGSEPQFRSLRFFVGLFLASSIALTLNYLGFAWTEIKVFRYSILGVASVLMLRFLRHTRLSSQGVAWLASALYAFATVVYTSDLPATVLRSTAFLGLTIAAFLGGFTCYRQTDSMQLRLPRRIAGLLAVLGIPSFVGLVLGAPAGFYFRGILFRGLFCHPNTLGGFASLWLVVGVGVYDSRPLRHRRLVLAGLVAMAFVLLGSRSRGGIGGTLIVTAFYFLTTRRVGRVVFSAVSLAVLASVLFIVLPSTSYIASQEATSLVFKGESNDVLFSRRDVWEIGIENFEASPWLGHGFGTSVGEDSGEWKIVDLSGREKGNAYLAILEETGLVGSPIMVLPVGLCLLMGVRLKRLNLTLIGNARELVSDTRLATAFWAGAVGGIVNNFAESSLWSPGAPIGGLTLFLAGAAEGLMLRTEGRK